MLYHLDGCLSQSALLLCRMCGNHTSCHSAQLSVASVSVSFSFVFPCGFMFQGRHNCQEFEVLLINIFSCLLVDEANVFGRTQGQTHSFHVERLHLGKQSGFNGMAVPRGECAKGCLMPCRCQVFTLKILYCQQIMESALCHKCSTMISFGS